MNHKGLKITKHPGVKGLIRFTNAPGIDELPPANFIADNPNNTSKPPKKLGFPEYSLQTLVDTLRSSDEELSTPARRQSGAKLGTTSKEEHVNMEMHSPFIRLITGQKTLKEQKKARTKTVKAKGLESLSLQTTEKRKVPTLAYGLDRVLFNPGVYRLQDSRSRVYNFDPYLEKIMPITEFNFDALPPYQNSSQDKSLGDLARKFRKKYVGSTSSTTSVLTHFHYLISEWRFLNFEILSKNFPDQHENFTKIMRAPSSIFLRWKNGHYAIDIDREYQTSNTLMHLGKSMEKLLVSTKEEYERYRQGSARPPSNEEINQPEAHHYSTHGDFLLRSQLDAYDPRLPGTGMFDLKTRSVLPLRMDSVNDGRDSFGYELHEMHGEFWSFEREYYDLVRSTMLKFSLQARMGHMDGIFLAFHNIQRMFGFQYLPIEDMDQALHGQKNPCLGDQEFKLSLHLLNKVLNRATHQFPKRTLRLHFETREAKRNFMYIFAEPMTDEEADAIQNKNAAKVEKKTRRLLGLDEESAKNEDDEPPEEEGLEAWQEAQNKVEIELQASEPSNQDQQVSGALKSNTSTSAKKDQGSELHGMVLVVRNNKNGKACPRIEDLTQDDEWTLDYSLLDMVDKSRAWNHYGPLLERRRKLLTRTLEDEETMAQSYLNLMRKLSKQSRDWRSKRNSLDASMDRTDLVFRPLDGKGAELSGTTMPKKRIDEDYMTEQARLLYEHYNQV